MEVLMLSHGKYFSGLMMVMLNVGSKYITIELSDSQKNLLNKYVILDEIYIFRSFGWEQKIFTHH